MTVPVFARYVKKHFRSIKNDIEHAGYTATLKDVMQILGDNYRKENGLAPKKKSPKRALLSKPCDKAFDDHCSSKKKGSSCHMNHARRSCRRSRRRKSASPSRRRSPSPRK
jgi:hypothetical protein